MNSYVYVAESGKGICKIGKSDNPELRIETIEKNAAEAFYKECADKEGITFEEWIELASKGEF